MSSIVYNKPYQDVLPQFSDGFFDIAVCDIPYGIDVGKMGYISERNTRKKQKNGSLLNPRKNTVVYSRKDWDQKPPPQKYFDELCRISKHQIIFGIDYVDWTGVGAGRIRWDKLVPDAVTFNRYETAYCSMITNEITLPLLWSGMFQAKSLSEPTVQQGNKRLNEKRIHPCHKPVMLYDLIYQKFGSPGMKIIDTHLGGGSNRISCDRQGFDFVGCEIDPEYYADQEARYRTYKSKLTLNFNNG